MSDNLVEPRGLRHVRMGSWPCWINGCVVQIYSPDFGFGKPFRRQVYVQNIKLKITSAGYFKSAPNEFIFVAVKGKLQMSTFFLFS